MERKNIKILVRRRLVFTIVLLLVFTCLPSVALANEVENFPPVADSGGPYFGYEGSPVLFDASGSYDPDNDPLFFNWDFDEDGHMDLRFWLDDPTVEYTWYDDHYGDVTVFVKDDHDHISTDTTTVTIYNLDPIILTLDGLPSDPIAVGSSVDLVCTFTDPGIYDTHYSYIKWGDGSWDESEAYMPTFSASHTYNEAGVYTMVIYIVDDDGGIAMAEFQYVVVFDPNEGGFVTGGGWVNSPEGAYKPDPSLSGKATFGFVSKYKKGQSIPSGNTEFQFHTAGLNFHSSEYEWLITAGSKAMFKGSGTINGEGDFGFMITAIDGDLQNDDVDKFRIKIWDKTNDETIYDNLVDEEDESGIILGGGQIVIHKK